jgi:CheY-like chemotaxis protein
MNAILGFSELLAESPLEGKYREYLNIVKSRGQDLLQIIDNVLGLARLEANQIPILAESFSIRDCITSVVADVRPGVQIKGLAFVTTLEDDLPELVCGDSIRVHQVLTKLLSSSVKLTATGEIRLAVKLDTSPKENQTRIVFSISDTGIGFALEDLDTIFDPQTKEDAYRTRTFGGVNLDLIIVRHLIKAMNGEIYVDSRMGRGTNFKFHLDFTLPVTPIKQKVFDSLIASPPSMTILLADDDITSRILFGAMLRRDGHTVVEAMDGGMALASASQMDFDLVLMDIQMPGMDGISATRAIRSMKNQREPVLEKRSAVPIVALTAHALPEDEKACLNAGMNGYLKKPLQADTLRACLNTYAKKKPQ